MNVICAYPVNLDAVHDVSEEEIASSARGIVPEAKERITGLEDLFSALLFCMQKGSGAELLIDHEHVAHLVESTFSWQYRLGGNAGIMANILASLGAYPVLNAPLKPKDGRHASSRRQSAHFRRPERAAAGSRRD